MASKTALVEPLGEQKYVVVCEGYHAAVGPFENLDEAIQASNKLNTEGTSPCGFVPVMLTEVKKVPDKATQEWRGQYL